MVSKISSSALSVKFASVVTIISLVSCASPDQRTYENGWSVTRNQCGDVSATIREKEQFETRYQRQIELQDQQNKSIYLIEVSATRGGVSRHGTTYSNDLANRVVARKVLKTREINKELKEAINTYYDEPGKYDELDQRCLVRGV